MCVAFFAPFFNLLHSLLYGLFWTNKSAASPSHHHGNSVSLAQDDWLSSIGPVHVYNPFASPPSLPVSPYPVFRWVMEMRELTVLAGSFIGFQFLFTVASPRISSAITPDYGRLPSTKLIEWNSRYVIWTHCFCAGKKAVSHKCLSCTCPGSYHVTTKAGYCCCTVVPYIFYQVFGKRSLYLFTRAPNLHQKCLRSGLLFLPDGRCTMHQFTTKQVAYRNKMKHLAYIQNKEEKTVLTAYHIHC